MWLAATWKWPGWKLSRRELDSGWPVAARSLEAEGWGQSPKRFLVVAAVPAWC